MEILQDIAAVSAIVGGLISAMTFGKRRFDKHIEKLVRTTMITQMAEFQQSPTPSIGVGPII